MKSTRPPIVALALVQQDLQETEPDRDEDDSPIVHSQAARPIRSLRSFSK